MNKDLIEQAFNAVIAKEKCYVRTGFHQLDTAFSKYSKGSLFTFYGYLSKNLLEEILTNLVKNNLSCNYILNSYAHIEFMKKNLMQGEINPKIENLIQRKSEISKWNLNLIDNIFIDYNDFKNKILFKSPHYIFINNIQDIQLKYLPINFVLKYLNEFVNNNNISEKQRNITISKINEITTLQEHTTETQMSIDEVNKIYDEIINEVENNLFSNTDKILNLTSITSEYLSGKLKDLAQNNQTIIFVNYSNAIDDILNENLKGTSDVVIQTELNNMQISEDLMVNLYILKNINGYTWNITNELKYDICTEKFINIGAKLWKDKQFQM